MMRTAGVMLLLLAGCFTSAAPSEVDKATTSPAPLAADQEEQEPFPLDAGAGNAKPVPFDGKRAMKYLEAICDIGPRQCGTAGMREQVKLVTKHFEALGLKVEVQTFMGKQVSRKEAVEMKNLVVRFFPDRMRRVVLCSHYDTRPIADQEEDPRKWREKFVSANDGGSGVAFLMELANHMKDLKTSVGVDFVLFDGEEYIFDNKRDEYFFGSKHFAKEYVKNRGKMRYGGAVLLDMIAGHGAKFPLEGNSWQRAKGLCKQIWGIALDLKVDMFENRIGDTVTDDHISLLDVGIPAIDVIDFSYEHWHKLGDVPSACSAQSLTDVSKVLSVWLQRIQ